MNPEIKKQWVDALRSGKYEQGKARLRRGSYCGQPDQFCCLGVLCDLHSQATGIEWGKDNSRELYSYMGSDGFLPLTVCGWAGISHPNFDQNALTRLNDGGVPFPAIATFIEEMT